MASSLKFTVTLLDTYYIHYRKEYGLKIDILTGILKRSMHFYILPVLSVTTITVTFMLIKLST